MRTTLIALAAGALVAGLALPATAAHEELVVTGLTQNDKLVTFVAGSGERLSQVKVSGVEPGQRLVAIDYRPATGTLYGVATGGGAGFLYEVDDTTGVAALVGGIGALTGDVSIDFNPTVDRLRVVSSDEDNLRVNPDTAATTRDGELQYAAATAMTGADAAVGQDPGIVGAAYTNNDNDGPAGTGTTLYDLDATRDQLVVQAPPNAGTLRTQRGPLGIDVDDATGFDVYSEIVDGTLRNIALLSTRTTGGTLVYTLNLETGAVNTATSGARAQGAPVVDIAVDPRQ